MKKSFRLLPVALALIASACAFAQTTDNPTRPPHGRHFGPPPGVVNADGTIALPDGTVLPAPTVNTDGTITLPDGTVIDPTKDHPDRPAPIAKNADGSLTLPDGTVIQPNADGTYTTPDGHVIDLSKAPPGRGPGGHRGRPPSGE